MENVEEQNKNTRLSNGFWENINQVHTEKHTALIIEVKDIESEL